MALEDIPLIDNIVVIDAIFHLQRQTCASRERRTQVLRNGDGDVASVPTSDSYRRSNVTQRKLSQQHLSSITKPVARS